VHWKRILGPWREQHTRTYTVEDCADYKLLDGLLGTGDPVQPVLSRLRCRITASPLCHVSSPQADTVPCRIEKVGSLHHMSAGEKGQPLMTGFMFDGA
jgi:hypothetical protein